MSLYDVLDQVVALLKSRGRVTYRALKREFNLDDDFIEDLKEEILYAHPVTDDEGRGLIWTGETEANPVTTSQPTQFEPQPITETAQTTSVEPTPIETRASDTAERRQLTVMFVDLVDSTRLSSQLDPEDLREIIREYQRSCSEVVAKYAGNVAQLLGDGLLVYFGYPVAHEDDAQRAVRSGLGIIEAIGALNSRLEQDRGVKLTVRLGIHTGLVVVGEMGGQGRQEQLALGETPNVAARIQGLAEPDTVVISDATYRLIQGYFDTESLGEHDLRGVTQPMVVYRILRESGAQSRLDIASTRGLTSLVGRESESTLLFERWEQTKDGNGQVILLSGEAGIGKSRLVQVLKDHVADEPHTRLECRSLPYFTNSALYPIIDMMQRTLQIQADDTAEQRLEKLERNLSQCRVPLAETVPLFAPLLSLSAPVDRYPSLNLSPQRQRQMTLEAIVAIVLEQAEQQPVLFILEDLHWTDPTTLELIEMLITQTPTASIGALLTCRPEYQPSWGHRSYLTEITINRLSQQQIERLAKHIAGGKRLPASVLQPIVEKTDGVPLFIEEMTKAVLESGFLKELDGGYELTDPVSSLAIPATLQDSLMARLDRLVTAKAVAQYASVIGRQFSYELLQAVSQLDEALLQHELRRLVKAELVYQRGLPPQATYTFKHALIQDTAYESLLRSTRQGYHRRIAEVLTARFPEMAENQPELLALHYTEAGLNEQAVAYWYKSGHQADERSAHLDAIVHFTKGLEILQTLPDTVIRRQQELRFNVDLGKVLMMTKGYGAPEAGDVYARARELCQQVGETPHLAPALVGLWAYYFGCGEYRTAQEMGEQLLSVARQVNDSGFLLLAHRALGITFFYLGELTTAHAHLEQGVALYDPQQHDSLALTALQNPGVTCLCFSARTLWYLGFPDQARQQCHKGLALAQQITHPFSLAFARCFAAHVHQFCRERQTVQEQSEAAVILSRDREFSFYIGYGTILRGWSLVAQGQAHEGLKLMRQGILQTTGTVVAQPYFLALLAEGYAKTQCMEESLQTLSEALEVVHSHDERDYESELYRLTYVGTLEIHRFP